MTARDRLRERRDRHRKRPLLVRALVVLGGLVTLLGGLALLVLPGPGIPLLVVGLGLLALEYRWAETALGQVLRHAERVTPTTGRQRIVGATALVATTAAAAVAVAFWGTPVF